ncbi:MAG: PAS domain-containing sensor histidine kinase [Muribaculaceae bacterium]|nr:PAS domain-containing sensor histidine kinase [Muribaculaceae bacterium]
MAYEFKSKWHMVPLVWIILTVLLAFGAGYAIALGKVVWLLLGILSICCGYMIFSNITRISKKMRYVMEANLNRDFSYKFPTHDVNKDERETNEMLNRIVEHLELMTLNARQNEAFLAQVLNMTDIGLALADVNGDIRLHNEAALRLLNRKVLTHICQIPQQAYEDLDIKKGNVTVNEKSFTLFTITDLRRQMQAVEVESWEKLTRVLTHEIMNSLTPIQSIAENMSGKTSDREITEALSTISSSSRSLMQFVKNFREFSILPEARMRAVYLKPLLESSIRIAESYEKGKHVSIELICFPPELMVYTDEALLSRVLINILKNAIEANPENISIEADEKADESIEIRISNDGELISEDMAEHIFTPFFTTRANGSGIGLSLSRRIVTHLGGTLSLKTRPLTCFTVRL